MSGKEGSYMNGPWRMLSATFAMIGLSTGGLGMAISWHSQSPYHHGAATQRDLDNIYNYMERQYKQTDVKLDQLTSNQQKILRKLDVE